MGGNRKRALRVNFSEISTFETEYWPPLRIRMLTDLCGRWVDQIDDNIPMKQLVLGMGNREEFA